MIKYTPCAAKTNIATDICSVSQLSALRVVTACLYFASVLYFCVSPFESMEKSGESMGMTVGERIKKRRKRLKLSIIQIAEALGRDKATLYRYESNYIEDLPSSVIEPLARSLRTTPAYLMGWNEELSDRQMEILQRIDCLDGKFSAAFADEVGRGEIEFLLDCGLVATKSHGEMFELTEKGKKTLKAQGIAPEFLLRPGTVVTVSINGEITIFEQVGKREMSAVGKILRDGKKSAERPCIEDGLSS